MINVYNHMWVYTDDHKLHVIDTSNMNTIACVAMENSPLEVVQLLHVPEWHMVLVLWGRLEIWCLHDEADASGVHLVGSLQLTFNIPIISLCRVNLKRTTEVWAIIKDKGIMVFAQLSSGRFNREILSIPGKSFNNYHLITCLNFSTATGKFVTHVWLSFDRVPNLVCWDGEEKSQLHTVLLKG